MAIGKFMCGGVDHWDDQGEPLGHAVHVSHLAEHDRTIEELSNLPTNREAERQAPGEEWEIFESDGD